MRAVLTVIGSDRVGIIAGVSSLLAESNINILDISQTTMQEIFTMIMLVDTSAMTISFTELGKLLDKKGAELGVTVSIQREDIFNSMHRI
jgi:ACT domain-containing protein